MTKKKSTKNLLMSILPLLTTFILGVLGTILTYSLEVSKIEIPINHTQTAEARALAVVTSSPIFTPTPSQTSKITFSLEHMLLQGDVPFVWQWAGENWYGRVILSDINGNKIVSQANMGIIQKTTEDAVRLEGKVFSLAPGTLGTFVINDDGSITLDFAIEKKSRRTGVISTETINGTLKPALCYAGSFSYTGSEGPYTGDVVLVNDTSTLGFSVDEWFRNNQDWFDSYPIDK